MLDGLSWLYGKIIASRNSLYNRGALKSKSLPAPTISVGNITVGGTGKTPLVEYIARLLANQKEKVCILTRGYRRRDESARTVVSDFERILTDPERAGDEAFLLAKKLLRKAMVVADRDRISAAEWALEKFGATVFVLDDAFQHRKVKRELDIVVIDATNPFGNLKQLPSGTLREDPNNLARADLIVISRADLCGDLRAVEEQIQSFAPGVPLFSCQNLILGFTTLSEFNSGKEKKHELADEPAFVFCGIGNPRSFISQLVLDKTNVVDSKIFPDHHHYTGADIDSLQSLARKKGAKVLVTTAKDAVKLDAGDFRIPCLVCEIDLTFQNEIGFAKMLDEAIS